MLRSVIASWLDAAQRRWLLPGDTGCVEREVSSRPLRYHQMFQDIGNPRTDRFGVPFTYGAGARRS